MGLQANTAQEILNKLSKHLERKQNSLRLALVCHDGNITRDALIATVANHEKNDELTKIAQKTPKLQNSACLGVAKTTVSAFLGMTKKQGHIALISINLKDIKDKSDLVFMVYRGIGEAQSLIQDQENEDVTLAKPRQTRERVIFNLITDIFAGLMMVASGHEKGFEHIAQKRAEMSLVPRAGYLPEDYPYAIAYELVSSTYGENPRHENAPYKFADILETATAYAKLVDGTSIQKWRNFVTPAQNMIWRGYSKEQALSSAVRFSEDASATQVGMMVSDLLEYEALENDDMPEFYNGFASDERNIRQHEKSIEHIFETVISKSHSEQSADYLFEKANELNIKLTGGRIMGWCSNALQAAGKAFDAALRDQDQRDEASNIAREKFEEAKADTNWESLRKFGEIVIKKNRIGQKTGLQEIKDLADQSGEFAVFADSVAATLKDPIYMKTLEAVNDVAPIVEGPKVTHSLNMGFNHTLGLQHDGARPTYAPPAEMSLGLGSKDGGARKFKGRALSVVENDKKDEKSDKEERADA